MEAVLAFKQLLTGGEFMNLYQIRIVSKTTLFSKVPELPYEERLRELNKIFQAWEGFGSQNLFIPKTIQCLNTGTKGVFPTDPNWGREEEWAYQFTYQQETESIYVSLYYHHQRPENTDCRLNELFVKLFLQQPHVTETEESAQSDAFVHQVCHLFYMKKFEELRSKGEDLLQIVEKYQSFLQANHIQAHYWNWVENSVNHEFLRLTFPEMEWTKQRQEFYFMSAKELMPKESSWIGWGRRWSYPIPREWYDAYQQQFQKKLNDLQQQLAGKALA